MQASYLFNCPSIAYDLRIPRNTDEFDAWFLVEHEHPSLPPSDIFGEFSPNKENGQTDDLNKRRRQSSNENEKNRLLQSKDLKSVGAQKRLLSAGRESNRGASSSAQIKPTRYMSSPRPRPSSNRSLIISATNDAAVASNRQVLLAGKPIVTGANRLASMSRSQSACKSRPASRASIAGLAAKSDDNSLDQLIRQHNEKIAPVAEYEPRVHRGGDYKRWEISSGRQWDDLKPEEKIRANEEIRRLKETKTFG